MRIEESALTSYWWSPFDTLRLLMASQSVENDPEFIEGSKLPKFVCHLNFFCLLSGNISCQIYNTRADGRQCRFCTGMKRWGRDEQHTEPYLNYDDGVAEFLTQRFAQSAVANQALLGLLAVRCKCGIGAHGARETPVPMPNTEVKPSSGYNTWVLALGK
jgi:hypothetical protein